MKTTEIESIKMLGQMLAWTISLLSLVALLIYAIIQTV